MSFPLLIDTLFFALPLPRRKMGNKWKGAWALVCYKAVESAKLAKEYMNGIQTSAHTSLDNSYICVNIIYIVINGVSQDGSLEESGFRCC